MNLYLRKIIHPQAHDNYRVILKGEDGEFEIGSIGIQHSGAWSWGIDTVIPVRSFETEGEGRDRSDCMQQFKAAWERLGGRAGLGGLLSSGLNHSLGLSEVDIGEAWLTLRWTVRLAPVRRSHAQGLACFLVYQGRRLYRAKSG